MRKAVRIIILVLVLGLVAFLYWRYYFVFAEGTKAGVLNTIQKKGFLFKTYEGKLIQSGFGSNNTATGTIQSNYFDFSVANERIGKQLMENSGKNMELHYNRYLGALPWRGTQSYIVDSIYQIEGVKTETGLELK
jgi:hypothetical protein